MAPKSSKRGLRKLSIKKSTVRDLKALDRGARAVKGGVRATSTLKGGSSVRSY